MSDFELLVILFCFVWGGTVYFLLNENKKIFDFQIEIIDLLSNIRINLQNQLNQKKDK
jgi:hypothetical protein